VTARRSDLLSSLLDLVAVRGSFCSTILAPPIILTQVLFEALGLSVTAGAKVLGVSRQALSNLVTGKAGVSANMAIRLPKAFGSTAETWLRMQLAYDLAAAMKHERRIRVRRLPPEYGLIFLLAWLWRLLRRGPLTTAIPRMSAGGLETGNRCPGLGDPPRLLPRHCCQRFF